MDTRQQPHRNHRVRVALSAPVAVLALGGASIEAPTPAEDGPRHLDAGRPGDVDLDDHVVVEDLDPTGAVLATRVVDAEGRVLTGARRAAALALASTPAARSSPRSAPGSGRAGAAASARCRRVTVHNEKESLLGWTMFWYNTWTRYCWNGAHTVLGGVDTGWALEDVDDVMRWRGHVRVEERHFPWRAGYRKSGHRHERQGHLENCWSRWGCLGNSYPRNRIDVRADGSYAWATWG